MKPEEAKKHLGEWEPVLITVDEPFTGNHTVPGWKCRKCGAQYGCVVPPEKCWHCPTDKEVS